MYTKVLNHSRRKKERSCEDIPGCAVIDNCLQRVGKINKNPKSLQAYTQTRQPIKQFKGIANENWGENKRWVFVIGIAYRGFGGLDLKKKVAEGLIARSSLQVSMAIRW